MNTYTYIGQELDVFAKARNWKEYWRHEVQPFVGTRIADIGAGIGSNIAVLGQPGQEWTCVEPDGRFAERINSLIARGNFPFSCRVVVGRVGDLEDRAFDTVLYLDVLEHIEDDRAELANAAEKLQLGGHLIVLSPAYPLLYSPFDAALGHYRRYTRTEMLRVAPAGLETVSIRYLDSAGVLASLANRIWLRSAYPTPEQVQIWDRFVVPCSRVVDRALGFRIGKSILCVWRRL